MTDECITAYKINFKGNFHTLSKLAFHAFIIQPLYGLVRWFNVKWPTNIVIKCRTDEQKQVNSSPR